MASRVAQTVPGEYVTLEHPGVVKVGVEEGGPVSRSQLMRMPAVASARRCWLTGILALAASCGGGTTTDTPPPPPPPPGTVASVALTPGSGSVVVGEGRQLTATVRDARNNVLTGRSVSWTSSNPSLATVSATGQVIGQYQGGPVTIQASVDGVVGTATVTVTAPQAPSVVELRSVMDSAEAALMRAGADHNGDLVAALVAAATRMESDPRVRRVDFVDTTALQIELKTGMRTMLRFDEVGADGKSLYRGGGGGGGTLTRFGRAANLISNRAMLICAAEATAFYGAGELERVADLARHAGLGLAVTVLRDEQCNWRAVQTFQAYGLVILDTHGFENGFIVGGQITLARGGVTDSAFKASVDAEQGAGTFERLVAGDLGTTLSYDVGPAIGNWWQRHQIDRSVKLWVSSQFVRQLNLANTVVFGNMCYSGARNGRTVPATGFIQPAFMSTGTPTYYGYAYLDGESVKVPNTVAKVLEEALIRALTLDGDSTGTAHLDANGQEPVAAVGAKAVLVPNSGGGLTVPRTGTRELLLRQDGELDHGYVTVEVGPVDGEFGKPMDFVADDHGSAPLNAIYQWDFGDGTSKLRVNGLPLAQHTYQLPPGTSACADVSFPIKLEVLSNSSGATMATSQTTARLKSPCPNWKLTTFVGVDDLVDEPGTDPGQGGPFFDLLWGAKSVPGSALISLTGNQLSMRVRRAGEWTTCCQFGADDHVFTWPTWSQSTTDLDSGTVTGVRTEGQSEFRFQATRTGRSMTGTMTLVVVGTDDETGQPFTDIYTFTFTAERMQ